MSFVADLHIHSRFSMATSKALTIPHLSAWAVCKGIDVLGCGDFTHPAWRAELRENLVFDEKSGFYLSRHEPENLDFLQGRCPKRGKEHTGEGPCFCIQAEISSIYKKAGKTRKVHNLVFMPTLEAADKFAEKLALVGNIASDGRPILGLDSHDLLEMVLETSEDAVLIPAHIWTPWFSLFGSRSGFDSIEECYGDLTPYIFALETGLSSDPVMNRHLSALDNYALVSNSDAHSGPNLGREANLFAGSPSWGGMFAALRNAARHGKASGECQFQGTLEFYPEEGKYHLDGHRACGVVIDPSTGDAPTICPVCGKPLTIGVLRRVMELADRPGPGDVLAEAETRMLVPLPEILGEILGAGPATRKVRELYAKILRELGPELDALCRMPEAAIRHYWEPLGEAVARIRAGQTRVQPGFDGQYGVIRVFDDADLLQIRGSGNLPGMAMAKSRGEHGRTHVGGLLAPVEKTAKKPAYSPAQIEAMSCQGPALVLAGPGSGKTHVLVGRILRLLGQGHPAGRILAITFTRRAAEEMHGRLAEALPANSPLPLCDTVHALAWSLSRQEEGEELTLLNDALAQRLFAEANPGLPAAKLKDLWLRISVGREKNVPLEGEALLAGRQYAAAKDGKYLDYGDLLDWLLERADALAEKWDHILVDEAQDLSPLQLDIIARLAGRDGKGFFGIGDPDQAIYDFRGASGQSEEDFKKLWPRLRVLRLGASYRASQPILDLAANALEGRGHCGQLRAVSSAPADLRLFMAPDEKEEARWIAAKIKALLGSSSHSLLDGAKGDYPGSPLAPEDIAILTRLRSQMPVIARALENAGLPFSMPAAEMFWEDELCASFLEQARNAKTAAAPDSFLRSLEGDRWAMLGKSPAFAALCSLWNKYGGWDAFFQKLAWLHEAELIAARGRGIRFLTLHASKGLEFRAVFIPGLEDGLLPMRPELVFGDKAESKTPCELESERRLLYVGATRAAEAIFFSSCRARRMYGKNLRLAPSPFIPLLKDFCKQSELRVKKREREINLSLFDN